MAEPGDDGKGIKVRKGDRFTIPAGAIAISLDPRKSTGRLYRPGLTWFVQAVLVGDVPKTADKLEGLIDKWETAADGVLESSERLKGFDLEDEEDAQRALELIQQDKHSVEFWAVAVGSFAQELKDRLASGASRDAVLSAVRLSTFWSMLVFARDLEEHVWTGYKHNQLIYGIARAGAQTPAEAEAIAALEPAFKKLTEDVLHAWVESGVDIGPRLGVTGVDEPLLKALAKYHLNLFERARTERQLTSENRARIWAVVGGSFTAGAATVGAALGVLKAVGVI